MSFRTKINFITFLLLWKLLRLVPDLSGVQEVGGDLDVAGGHLMDTLRYGHRRAGAASAADRRVTAGRAWRQLGGHWRGHTCCLAALGNGHKKGWDLERWFWFGGHFSLQWIWKIIILMPGWCTTGLHDTVKKSILQNSFKVCFFTQFSWICSEMALT